jgi:hypothetical protein
MVDFHFAGKACSRSLSRYLHVIGDRAKPNSNRFPDGTFVIMPAF